MNTRTSVMSKWAVVPLLAAFAIACALSVLPVQPAWAAGLSKGDVFTTGGNSYRVTDFDSDDADVVLVKYGSTSKKPVVNTVKYQGTVFEVEAIGKGAFNNAKGHKVVQVTLGAKVDKIGAKAFYGCSKLKALNMRKADVIDIDYEGGTYRIDDIDIGASAFKKAGTKGITVRCGSTNATYQKLYKKALMKKGMRSSVSVVK